MAVVLASASPRRRELLAWVCPDFTVIPSSCEERVPQNCPAAMIAQTLAEQKAEDVAAQHPDDVVIGCDTVVVYDDHVLGKPKDAADCAQMLRALSGNKHTVYTGVCLRQGERVHCFTSSADVWFYPLSDEEIAAYIATGEPFDKAGGYGIQGKGGLLVERIDGDYYAIVGLPVARLRRELDHFLSENN